MENFLQSIKEQYYNNGAISAQEYLTPTGFLDHQYIQKISGVKIGINKFINLVNLIFGQTRFEISNSVSEVSFDEFREEYEFGKYLEVKRWSQYWRDIKGKHLPVKTLYNYVLKIKN